MRILGLVVAVLVGKALILYGAGLGIYAVASTKPSVSTQPRTPAQARSTLEQFGLVRAYPFENRFILLPHGRMHYVDEGEGAVTLCLHGNGSWSLECAAFVKMRSAKARVLAPDLIGFGLSEKPARAEGVDVIESHAADLAALLQALDLHDVQLSASHSTAAIALRLVRLSPDRVRSTVIEEQRIAENPLASRVARMPVLGEMLTQGFGGLSPGFAHGSIGRAQGNWQEREAAWRSRGPTS